MAYTHDIYAVIVHVPSPRLAVAARVAEADEHTGELGDVHIAIPVQVEQLEGTHHASGNGNPFRNSTSLRRPTQMTPETKQTILPCRSPAVSVCCSL